MTLVAAAHGDGAALAVAQMLRRVPTADRTIISFGACSVGWDRRSPFLSHTDRDDAVVLLDGFLHNAPPRDQAAWLHARYRRGGIRALAEGVLGDFICVVGDRKIGNLFIVRDALGVRPWYHSRGHRPWVGSTNASAAADVPGVDRSLDVGTAARFLAGNRVSTGPTLFAGIATLAPGHTLDVAAGRAARHHRFDERVDRNLDWDHAVTAVREVFSTAVLSRVDPRFASTAEVSGGLDSSAVAGALASARTPSLVAARLLFDDPAADERKYSDAVAEQWGLELISAAGFRPSLDDLAHLTRATGLPMGDINGAMAAGLHRELVGRDRRYVFTGVGGDDAFLSAPVGARAVAALQHGDLGALRSIVTATPRSPRRLWRGLLRPVSVEVLGRRPPRFPWLRDEVVREVGLVDEGRARPAKRTGDRAVDYRWGNLTSGYLASVLERVAAVGDTHGLRLTHPYLDPRLIEVAYGVQPGFAVRPPGERALQREALGSFLPAEVRGRRDKAEFSAITRSVLLDRTTKERLLDGRVRREPWVDPVELGALLARAQQRRPGTVFPLMGWLGIELWLGEFGA